MIAHSMVYEGHHGNVLNSSSFVYESVRWLMERGEAEKSEVILRKIAGANGREVSEAVYDDFRALVNKQFEDSKGSAAPGFLTALR